MPCCFTAQTGMSTSANTTAAAQPDIRRARLREATFSFQGFPWKVDWIHFRWYFLLSCLRYLSRYMYKSSQWCFHACHLILWSMLLYSLKICCNRCFSMYIVLVLSCNFRFFQHTQPASPCLVDELLTATSVGAAGRYDAGAAADYDLFR